MKRKIVSIFMVLLFALVLVACDNGEKFDLEQEQATFDEMLLLVDISVPTANRSQVVNSFSVPVEIAGGGTVTWTSDKDAFAKFEVVSNQNLIVVNRPDEGAENETVKLTATLSWTGPSGEVYTGSVDFTIRVIAMPVSEVVSIADVRNGVYPEGENVKLSDVVIVHVASNGVSVFDPATKHAIFVYGSDLAKIVQVGDRGDIVGEYGVNFDSPQLSKATFTKKSTVALNDLLAMAVDFEVSNYWLEPGTSTSIVEAEIAAKIDPERNTFVKFTANVKDHPEWANGSTTNYTTVLHDPLDETKYVRSYYGGAKHSDLVTLSGTDNVTIYAVAYTVRNDRVKPATIEGTLPSFEIFVIHYDATLTDTQKVELDKSNLTVANLFLETTTVTLPTTGAQGSTISWETSDAAVFNVETGVVTVTPGESKEVTLTATIVNGAVTETKVFNIIVGEKPISTVTAVEAMDAGAEVKVKGTIVSFITSDRYGNSAVYLEDETGMLYLHQVSSAQTSLLVVGQEYEVEGVVAFYQNKVQLTGATLTKTSAAVVAPEATVLTRALTSEDVYSYVTIEGFVKTDATGRNISLFNGEIEYKLYASSSDDLSAVVYNEILALFKAGNKVRVTGIVGHYNMSPQVLLFAKDKITVLPVDAVGLAPLIKAAVPAPNAEVVSNLTLPNSIFGATITWSSSNTDVIANDGTVTRPAAGEPNATVTLTYTAKLGETDITLTDNTVEFTVLALTNEGGEPGEPETFTVTAAYPGGFTENMVAGNNATTIGLDGLIFTVTSTERVNNPLHVGLNTSGQIRLYGSTDTNGNILDIAVASGYEITKIEFEFGATVNNALIKAGETTLFTGALTANTINTYDSLTTSNVSIKNTATSTGQIYILSIKITYKAVA